MGASVAAAAAAAATASGGAHLLEPRPRQRGFLRALRRDAAEALPQHPRLQVPGGHLVAAHRGVHGRHLPRRAAAAHPLGAGRGELQHAHWRAAGVAPDAHEQQEAQVPDREVASVRAHDQPRAVGRHLHRRRVAEVGGQRARPRLRAAAQVPAVHHAALRREGEQRLRVPRQILDGEHRALAGRGYGADECGVDHAQRRLRRVALRRHAVVRGARARAHPPLLLAAARGARHAHAPVLDFEDVHGAV